MILYRWQGRAANFGDELNTLLWPRLLPDFFDDDPAVRFLGIGSILDRRHASAATKLVAGSGYGGYEAKPVLDRSWIIHWVRGRRTAARLGLEAALALGDPAVLLPRALGLPAACGHDVGFMPHFESAGWGAWQSVAAMAGVRLIDPRDPPPAILQAIRGCGLLLSQALHGVIVADALRVPWVAIRPLAQVHQAKWLDWAEMMALRPRFRDLGASTLLEWAETSRLSGFHLGRVWLERLQPGLANIASERRLAKAALSLRRAAQAAPQLSSDTALDRCQSRMLDAVHALWARPLRAPSMARAVRRTRSCLPASGDSAYQPS
ncbi:hypothetical protein [Rhodopila sp.]|uniref:hypothetical protein n=1 Tax=Rhodopila sp. TaxID=2480087 RepID=UPI003D14B14F